MSSAASLLCYCTLQKDGSSGICALDDENININAFEGEIIRDILDWRGKFSYVSLFKL